MSILEKRGGKGEIKEERKKNLREKKKKKRKL